MIQGLILCNPGAARTALQWICRECAAVWCATRCCPAASAASTTSAAPTVLADPVDPVDLAASGASAASDASDASAFPPAVMHADALVANFERELVLRRVVAAELQYGAVDEQKVAPPVSHTHSYLPIHPHLGRAQPHGWLLNWRGHRANEPAPAGYRTGGPSVPTKSPMCGRAWLLGRAEAGRGRSSGASTTQPSQ